jgi:poly-gamma-glutamate capsule biosynthesis protein CapA/YwtB (metallophosphatase superfamily)
VLAGRGGETLDPPVLPAAFQAADLLAGTLEGVLGAQVISVEAERLPYHLAGSPPRGAQLASAGFDLLGLANNHALDLGSAGLQNTAQTLDEAGLGWVGAGLDPAQAAQPLYRQAGNLRLAFLAVNAVPLLTTAGAPGWVPAAWDDTFLAQVRLAQQQADLVIVMLHWGNEYQRAADPAQRQMAASLLAAGADVLAGSHPHVLQEVEVIPPGERPNPQVVAYSLGNFIFDQGEAQTAQGLALRLLLDEHGILGVQAIPVHAGLQAALLPPEEAAMIVERLLQPAQPLVYACDAAACRQLGPGNLEERLETSGLFWSGQVDLTGDQAPELVRREAGQVIVYEQGQETWRTPAEWQVLDAALGDPDGDGRSDILLAMLKPDAQGVLRSHPFIMGYRGGIYRNLWGGSAVSDPIREIELGDLDGTPAVELVVLEERRSGLQAVTVWDWHGWGFSLRWRSPEGFYANLRLALDRQGGPAWIVVDPAR